jgi:hypothetical protein
MVEIRIAETAQERAAVAAFRYAIYVEEMGRYQASADHSRRSLADPEDAWSWIAYARDGDEIIGTTRMTWGGAGFTARQIDQYGLAPFLDELPGERLAVGERHMIAADQRGSDLFLHLGAALQELSDSHGVLAVFGACEPHLLSYYCRFQRPCGARNINSAEAGYLIPLVAFLPGPEALVDQGRHPGMPKCVQAVLDGEATVRSPLLTDPESYWHDVRDALAALEAPLFEGVDEVGLRQCVAGSNVIRCAEGDRIIKKNGSARNVYVVLTGALEVNDDEHPLAVLLPGDVFGETAYLMHRARTQNVDVLSDDTTVLSLSEHTLRRLTAEHPAVAAKLLENISRVLCERLAAAE